jgi:hypothetical protein
MITLALSHPQNPPATHPTKDGLRPTHYPGGGHLGGTPPHSRQGSPEVSPRTPFLPRPGPTPPRFCRATSEEHDASTDR